MTSIIHEPQAHDPLALSSVDTEAPTDEPAHLFEGLTQTDTVMPWHAIDFQITPTFALGSLPSGIQQQSPIQLTGDSIMKEAFACAIPAEGTSDTTTLCSLAFPLVLKNNL